MEIWRLIIDPPGSPSDQMARDEGLAREVLHRSHPPTLRVYRWSAPAITMGRRQNLDDLPAELLRKNLPIFHRPTGGGAVLHRRDEL
ncbi:MAG: lipoate--protein ligase family protein, partial [Candidatus Omnitrophica bacterium]|nr:lipoate--protein ligase family protein [Candidatus Omnitrophota bacterium]